MDNIDNFINTKYNELLTEILPFKHLFDNNTIIDVGSNIGLFSKIVADISPNYNSIHLFEPVSREFALSKTTLAGYRNIYYNNVAVGMENKNTVIYKPDMFNPDASIFETSTLLHTPLNDYTEQVTVVRLDDYYSHISDIGFIKIDVEGYERYVLEGAMYLIQKFKPYIWIEVGWGTHHPEWGKNIKTYEKLFMMGYRRVDFKDYTDNVLLVPE